MVAGLAGCGGTKKDADKTTEINVGYFNNVTHAQALYMKAQGTLDKAFDGKAVKEQLIDYFNNDFALSLRKEYDKNFNRNLMKWETDKNNYRYYIDDFQYFNEDIGLDWENYFFCTDMCDYTLFDDSINSDDRINIGFNFIPLYFDTDKTDSEDISFTLRLLNHFLRASLKSNLKNTLIFGLTD